MYEQILSIKAKALYPIVGGYNGYPLSLTVGYEEPIRATEIKGLWKWWTRILLESMIFKHKSSVIPYSEIDKVMEDVFGSMDKKSVVRLNVRVDDDFINVVEKIWHFLRSFFQRGQVVNQRNVSGGINIIIQAQNLNIYKININNSNNGLNVRVRRADRDPKPNDIPIVIDFNDKKISINGIDEKLEGLDKYLTIQNIKEFLSIPRIKLDMLKYNNIGFKVGNLGDYKLNELIRIILDLITVVLIPKEVEFTINVEVNKERLKNKNNELDINKVKKLKFALYSLFVYLILGGIGRMINRGMGSLSPTQIECHDDDLCKDLKLLFENFSKISNEDGIIEFIKGLVDFNKLEELSENYINEIRIASETNNVFYISDYLLKHFYAKEIKDPLNPLKCLKILGELTLSNNVNDPTFAREILGSPRKSGDIRLPSAFRFKILYVANKYYLIWYLLDRYNITDPSHSFIKKYENEINNLINKAKQNLGGV